MELASLHRPSHRLPPGHKDNQPTVQLTLAASQQASPTSPDDIIDADDDTAYFTFGAAAAAGPEVKSWIP